MEYSDGYARGYVIMDAGEIIQELNRRFAEPLPEFIYYRILVFFANEREN